MNIKEIVGEILHTYLEEKNYTLYDCKMTSEFGMQILQVLIDGENISTDDLAAINEFLSLKLDDVEVYNNQYLLEVSTSGAEKELRNASEIAKSISKYLFVKGKNFEYYGYLLSFNENVLELKINLKGRIKTIKINHEDVSFIRLAVKF